MEIVSEVTAHLENKPGRLAKICSALAQEKVDVRAITVMEAEGPSVLRFVTSDVETTKKVLTSLGTEYSVTEVLAVGLENRTGALARVLERLAEEHINIDYAYASTATSQGKALGIFHTNNAKRALQVLGEAAGIAGRRPGAGGPCTRVGGSDSGNGPSWGMFPEPARWHSHEAWWETCPTTGSNRGHLLLGGTCNRGQEEESPGRAQEEPPEADAGERPDAQLSTQGQGRGRARRPRPSACAPRGTCRAIARSWPTCTMRPIREPSDEGPRTSRPRARSTRRLAAGPGRAEPRPALDRPDRRRADLPLPRAARCSRAWRSRGGTWSPSATGSGSGPRAPGATRG